MIIHVMILIIMPTYQAWRFDCRYGCVPLTYTWIDGGRKPPCSCGHVLVTLIKLPFMLLIALIVFVCLIASLIAMPIVFSLVSICRNSSRASEVKRTQGIVEGLK